MNIRSKIQALITAANAKTGESDATLTDAVQTLVNGYGQGGGGYTVDDLATMSNPSGAAIFTVPTISQYAFYHRTGITSVKGESITTIQSTAFDSNTGITKVFAPNAELKSSAFAYCRNLAVAIVGEIGIYDPTVFRNCTLLHTVDFCKNVGFSNNAFVSCSALKTMVIRRTTLPTLTNITCFNGTPFASGGTGGTIYIPKVLYDHLGDGTSLDYKAATNWSTLDGYGTITWAQIEGSIYETQYADGTPIPTE